MSTKLEKAQAKHIFQTMCVSQDRNISLSMYKAVRAQVRNISMTKRDVEAWLNIPEFGVAYVHRYTDGTKEVMVQVPYFYEQRLIVTGDTYAELIYKLAFKIVSHKWDMKLSQIHEIEHWNFPKASRTDKQ